MADFWEAIGGKPTGWDDMIGSIAGSGNNNPASSGGSWWDSATDKLKEFGSGLVDTVSDSALDWIKAEAKGKVEGTQYVPGRSETVISEPSPLPYDGPQKEAQAAAAAMQAQTAQYLKWGGIALGVVALAAIVGARR